MAFPSLESALNKVSNRYLLVVLAAKRSRQLNRGAAARVESRHKKPTSGALRDRSGQGRVPREGRGRHPQGLSRR
jgi:DNA-directed RNA polymerase omega subunit